MVGSVGSFGFATAPRQIGCARVLQSNTPRRRRSHQKSNFFSFFFFSLLFRSEEIAYISLITLKHDDIVLSTIAVCPPENTCYRLLRWSGGAENVGALGDDGGGDRVRGSGFRVLQNRRGRKHRIHSRTALQSGILRENNR